MPEPESTETSPAETGTIGADDPTCPVFALNRWCDPDLHGELFLQYDEGNGECTFPSLSDVPPPVPYPEYALEYAFDCPASDGTVRLLVGEQYLVYYNYEWLFLPDGTFVAFRFVVNDQMDPTCLGSKWYGMAYTCF